MNAQDYWEKVYRESDPRTDVSWYQANPKKSLELISETGISKEAPILDAGGGASLLVDSLLDAGFKSISVLDISDAALQHARRRLGLRAQAVQWFHTDVTEFHPPQAYALWHDRAVFHFLVRSEDRANYVQVLRGALLPDAHVILGTFAEDGPTRCSGLPVARYSSELIAAELGPGFSLLHQQREVHLTPWGKEQKFNWFRFRYHPSEHTIKACTA